MKKTFISGLAVVVPFALTLWILITVFGAVDGFIDFYLQRWFGFSFVGLGLLLALAVIFIVGFVTKTALGKWFYNFINKIIFKMPLVNKIYKLAKETIDVITSEKAFRTVVKVEFPKAGVYSIGFLTNENTVFVPTTPNPTSGFLIKTDQYEIIDMSVEDALRYVISMGAVKEKSRG
jgi:uncharacterized membrane protein